MMKNLLLVAVIVAPLSACKTVDEMSYPERKQLAQEISQRCIGYGLSFGSEEHKTCVLAEARREIATREAARQRRQSGFTCQTFGAITTCF